MTAPALVGLTIENLRGSVTPFTLKFESNRKLTIVYGENGTGKSTICDALDLLGNEKVGSLENRGIGAATRPFWPSVGKVHADVKVTLATTNGTCTLSLDRTAVVVDNPAHKPQVAVLRRSQILNLIEAQPAERYKAISRFVDVAGVEASEATLRKLINDKGRDYETATARVGTSRTSIENFWVQVGSPPPNAISWAKTEIQKDQRELDQRKAVIDGLVTCWDKIAPLPGKLVELENQLKVAKAGLDQAKVSLNSITSDATDDYLEVLDILKAAQQHFVKNPHPTACPLCESSEKAVGLAAQVNRRIEAQGLHSKVDAARKSVSTQEGAVQRAIQRVEDFKKDSAANIAALQTYCAETSGLGDLELPAFPIPSASEKWAEWVDGNKEKRNVWKQAADACVDAKKFVETLRLSLKNLDEYEASAKEMEVILPRLRVILKIMEDERKKFTDALLSAISTQVGRLYEAIHPGEGLNKIVLALDAAKRGSLGIATEFAGTHGTPPQAYLSDSHLDTLGLCIFLALAEREVPEQKVLVLDDVLGSVDEPHVERVIGLIYEISQKFQHAVVTTHYRPWREKFRWGVLKPDQVCQLVELRRWSLGSGMALTGSIPEIERLKVLLGDSSPDVQAVTGKAGVILEALLDFVTLKYGCAVPRRAGNVYVLNDLLDAVNGKLLAALTVEIVASDTTGAQAITALPIKPILDEIKTIAQARNVLGAHFNSLAFDLYPNDGLRFARLVEQLYDAIVCPDYGWPMKDTGSYWKNGGDTRRLHPLKRPG